MRRRRRRGCQSVLLSPVWRQYLFRVRSSTDLRENWCTRNLRYCTVLEGPFGGGMSRDYFYAMFAREWGVGMILFPTHGQNSTQ
jgi:hypothetical protein